MQGAFHRKLNSTWLFFTDLLKLIRHTQDGVKWSLLSAVPAAGAAPVGCDMNAPPAPEQRSPSPTPARCSARSPPAWGGPGNHLL